MYPVVGLTRCGLTSMIEQIEAILNRVFTQYLHWSYTRIWISIPVVDLCGVMVFGVDSVRPRRTVISCGLCRMQDAGAVGVGP